MPITDDDGDDEDGGTNMPGDGGDSNTGNLVGGMVGMENTDDVHYLSRSLGLLFIGYSNS